LWPFRISIRSGKKCPEEDRTGKDWFALNREYQKLRCNFAGITEMERLPGAVFVIDPKREELLVKEANRLKILVLALTVGSGIVQGRNTIRLWPRRGGCR
jgi:ribosomal protein S2